MKQLVEIVAVLVLVAGCSSDGGGNKVLQDFGLQERPEDYVSGTDEVLARLKDVGATELDRLNRDDRDGDILYDDTDELHGKYYKTVKIYDRFYTVDANSTGKNSFNDQRGYVGYIEYVYELHESPRKNSRAEAIAELATIPSGEDGRETYRYRFDSSGSWNGANGELVR